ncbi:MAG: LacI family DNA-binding transcriptional regulator [Sulfitobacter sp.]
MRKPTLKDVGREAGISPITVSRALRSPEVVSEKLRKKVAEAIEKLEYTPNLAASTLAANQSNVIGILIPSFTNDVFTEVLSGAYEGFAGTRYSIQVSNTYYDTEKEQKQLKEFLNLRPAGLIVTGIDQNEASDQMLRAADCPIVQFMDLCDDPIDFVIGYSNYDGMAMATEHLVSEGYRRIGYINALLEPRAMRRIDGYRDVLTTHGIYDSNRLVSTAAISGIETGKVLFRELLSRAPECDAVICNNDDLSVGVALECLARGISIPDTMAICGFNDLDIAAQMVPPLTSVRTPRKEMGLKAAELIIAAHANPSNVGERIIDLGVTLSGRLSTIRQN